MKESYNRLIRYLPEHLRQAAGSAYSPRLEELRLRSGQPLAAVYSGKEQSLGAYVSPGDISALAMSAARGSAYAARDSLKNGYITVDRGCRIGFCGTAVISDGQPSNLRSLTSANMRLAREVKTAAQPVEDHWGGSYGSALIIAPPGMGKTTMLRDLIRRISSSGIRVAVADERGEIAAMENGLPGFDLGSCTDVLTGCPKALAILMLLKAMNPSVIALDEITAPEDAAAIEACRNCGVSILATVHGFCLEDVASRPIFKNLLDSSVFDTIVTISGKSRHVTVERRVGKC